MKVEFWMVGKTNEKYLENGMALYAKRLKRYLPFKMVVLPDVKGGGKYPPEQLKEKEAALILHKIQPDDQLVLLDERGKSYSSEAFAQHFQSRLNLSRRRLIFLVGGAYGFGEGLYQRADEQLALSKMTFSHQMIRLFFLEQLYRAMTILRNEPYHNT